MRLDSIACSAKFDAGCRKLGGFGCLEGRFGHQIGCQKRRRGSMGPSYTKVLKMSPNGRPGVNFGAPFGGLEPPWGRFGRHFGVPRCYFSHVVSENRVFVISMPVCSGITTLGGLGSQVGANWAQKSCPNRPLGALATV